MTLPRITTTTNNAWPGPHTIAILAINGRGQSPQLWIQGFYFDGYNTHATWRKRFGINMRRHWRNHIRCGHPVAWDWLVERGLIK